MRFGVSGCLPLSLQRFSPFFFRFFPFDTAFAMRPRDPHVSPRARPHPTAPDRRPTGTRRACYKIAVLNPHGRTARPLREFA
jgi:hypothetical protein